MSSAITSTVVCPAVCAIYPHPKTLQALEFEVIYRRDDTFIGGFPYKSYTSFCDLYSQQKQKSTFYINQRKKGDGTTMMSEIKCDENSVLTDGAGIYITDGGGNKVNKPKLIDVVGLYTFSNIVKTPKKKL